MMSTTDQYRTIVAGAGWVDRSLRGRLRFEGSDVGSFLQALLSNDVARVGIGEGIYATYLTPQGRMLADLELYRRPDWWLVGGAPGRAAPLAERLDQAIFSEDVRVSDESSSIGEIVVVGGDAAGMVASALSMAKDAVARLGELSQIDWEDGFVARMSEALLPMFKIFTPAERRAALVRRLEDAGIVEISDELAEALRVEAGRPRFGLDMTEETIPLEAGLLDRSISTSKGCYVGQEIIIRILHRGGGRVARRLVTLALDDKDGTAPSHGTPVWNAEREVGHLTSVAVSPSSGTRIALGYVHRDAAEVGQRLSVGTREGPAATVTGFAR